jgi:hypothetical protein
MTLFRMIVILVGGLVLLLAVVILRAETTRLHYEISKCERSADGLRQQLVEKELELARLRNPARIRQRVEQAVTRFGEESPPPETPRRRDRR